MNKKNHNRETKSTRKELFFPVKMVSAESVTGIEVLNSQKKSAVMITDSEGVEKVVNFCSDKYSLVPIEEILTPFEKVLKEKGIKYKATYRHFNYSRFYIDYIIDGMETKIQKGDSLKQRISIRHSYDGGIKFNIKLGYWRQICSNGMMGWADEGSFTRKHSGNLDAEFLEKITTNMVEQLEESYETIIKPFEVLAERKIENWADRLEEVLNVVNGTPKKFVEDIQSVIMKEAKELKVPVTDWLIFNGINYQLNHNKNINKRVEKREKIDGEVLNFMLKNEFDAKAYAEQKKHLVKA